MGKKAERCVKKFGGASEDIFNIIEGYKIMDIKFWWNKSPDFFIYKLSFLIFWF